MNLHFPCIFLDGIYTRGADDRLSSRRVVPHTEDIERLVDAQAVIQQASLLGQAALGERAGKRARRVQVLGAKELPLPPRCANFAGYSLHAGVGFKASDRAGLERLCRYILRPPLAKDRLQRREDGSIVVGLKRVWSDGTSALVFSPSELVERLVALVPPPRANQVIYRGGSPRTQRGALRWSPAPHRRAPRRPRRIAPSGSRGASSTGSAARPARLGSTPRATTGGREHAGPGAEPCAGRGESEVSGAGHQVGVPRRDRRRG